MDELNQFKVEKNEEIEIDLLELFHVFMAKIWVIILCVIIFAGVTFAGTKLLIQSELFFKYKDGYEKSNKGELSIKLQNVSSHPVSNKIDISSRAKDVKYK